MKTKLLYFTALFLAVPFNALAGGVIGLDQTITVPTFVILTDQGAYGDVFNFFFTVMMLSGLISVFFKNLIRLFRLNFG